MGKIHYFFVFCSKCQTKQHRNQTLMNQKTSDVWSEVFSDFMNYRCFDGGNGVMLALHHRCSEPTVYGWCFKLQQKWRHVWRFNRNLFIVVLNMFIFTPIWGSFPIWLTFFRWVCLTSNHNLFSLGKRVFLVANRLVSKIKDNSKNNS